MQLQVIDRTSDSLKVEIMGDQLEKGYQDEKVMHRHRQPIIYSAQHTGGAWVEDSFFEDTGDHW
jgi:hypothetical protein